VTLSATTAAADAPTFPAEMVRLPNGLRVLLAPDPAANLVTVRVTYAAGIADDPNGLCGLAHLTEHLVSERTEHVANAPGLLASAGATHVEAQTTLDATHYTETLPPERLETALWIESDRMGFAADALTQERVTSDARTLGNEDAQTRTDRLLGTFGSYLFGELYPAWHPYAGIAGRLNVDDAKLADVRAFLATWYVPSNATLVLAGAFDRDKALAAIERYFGPIPSASAPSRPALPAWSVPGMRLTVAAPTSTATVSVAWKTPAYGEPDDAALDLVASALSGPGNERFTRTLVAPGLASGVESRQMSTRASSLFSVTAWVEPGVNPSVVLAEIERMVADVGETLQGSEFDHARNLWRSSKGSLEAPWSRASRLASLASIDVWPGPRFDWGRGRYETLTAADVRRAASRWLGRQAHVTVFVIPRRGTPMGGLLIGRDEVQP
jgi:zinc protease